MAPTDEVDEPKQAEARAPDQPRKLSPEQEQRMLSNPAVLRAAAEIVKRKKAEAVENEEYEVAGKFHQKLQKLEAQIAIAEQLEAKSGKASESKKGVSASS
ncbi:unnamed protein product, partial [Polarella glacialis]